MKKISISTVVHGIAAVKMGAVLGDQHPYVVEKKKQFYH